MWAVSLSPRPGSSAVVMTAPHPAQTTSAIGCPRFGRLGDEILPSPDALGSLPVASESEHIEVEGGRRGLVAIKLDENATLHFSPPIVGSAGWEPVLGALIM